jgi:hypothetical protein
MRGGGSLILADGRGRACRVSARWRAGRPSRGCSGIPGERFDTGAQCCHEPPAASRGTVRQRGALTDHGNSATAPQVRVRHAWQQGGDPLIGSNGAVRGMPAGAAAGRRAPCNLWSARAHRRHTHATVLPATIDGIRAHFGNPTQITPLRMPASAGSPHEKTVHNGGYFAADQWLPVGWVVRVRCRRAC